MKNRREFLIKSTLGATALALAPAWLQGAPNLIKSLNKPNSLINGVQIGCITYSFRSLPDQSAEATLNYVKESGISAIELMGDPAESFAGMPASPINRMRMWQLGGKARRGETLSAEETTELAELQKEATAYGKVVADWRAKADMKPFEEIRKMYADHGVKIYAFKPAAFGQNNSDAEISYGMKAAKALGASHVTLEHPADDAHTMRLGKLGEQHKMSVAYHGHEQQTFDFWDTALTQSKRNALNLDMGHYIAAGHSDLIPLIEKQHKNILSMHTKDRQTPANGKGNVAWGNGDTPIGDVLKMMQKNKYDFPATIELEYEVPENSDPIKEVQKCLEFCRQGLV
ncbi:sugar phosphate isomerase/epimerase family protein [Algoriphagus hitonicola]|uniref:Sugar phosphate isomerase/epimerase n=1 Tax=Algoriphagus hitonicola TaxID=435880 RepID=A0A1I2TVC2_9BACT|nr:TIM barrel protein [Algoriphagus hitonicola]SFG68834.1 Sugar phosphate isomerase/epimerase [Algoriphagus hitonicola]